MIAGRACMHIALMFVAINVALFSNRGDLFVCLRQCVSDAGLSGGLCRLLLLLLSAD